MGGVALYNLESDPLETQDVSAAHPTRTASMREQLGDPV